MTESYTQLSAARLALASLCGSLCACSGEPLELGEGPFSVDRAALASYSAQWEGYLEAGRFPSGSDSVQLTLDAQGGGQIILGEGKPPPPLDADNLFNLSEVDEDGIRVSNSPREGFPYTVEEVAVRDELIRFSFRADEVFDTACSLQAPSPSLDDGQATNCVPLGAVFPNGEGCSVLDYANGQIQELSAAACRKRELCGHCECSARACIGSSVNRIVVEATLDEQGQRMKGSVLNGPSASIDGVLRLRRVGAEAAPQ